MQKSVSQKFRVHSIALPLGDPQDITLKALAALKACQAIYCEDTRKIQALLRQHSLEYGDVRFLALPGDSEFTHDFDADFRSFLETKKFEIGIVSDAGTPIVNDPGRGLLRFCREKGIPLLFCPGPSALTLAIQMTGGFGLPFYFAGFAPKTSLSDIESFFLPAKNLKKGTFCFFDTKYQSQETLRYLSENPVFADQKMALLREMTKSFEEVFEGTPLEVLSWLTNKLEATKGAIGEMTFLLEIGQSRQSKDHSLKKSEISSEVADLLEICSIIRKGTPKEAAKAMSKLTGTDVATCYKKLGGSG
jgi:16S rRNA (cytidine1402-2'-O)-methyltransferase